MTTEFQGIGGMETCRRISEVFHAKVARDPRLGPLFPKNLDSTTERVALFLAEQLGGPATYTAKRGKQSLRCRHAHLAIGAQEAEQWLSLMSETLEELAVVEPVRQRLRNYFEAAIRPLRDPFLALYRMPLPELQERLFKDPSLATSSDLGRSLICEAAGRWDAPRAEMLLANGAGADPSGRAEHGPLYRAANAQPNAPEEDGLTVVQLLLDHDAEVDRASGPGRSSPLHMTARRGHVLLAAALLRAGANIESRDSKGETPLRRAVNCRQDELALFLISRGTQPLSRDNLGRTPIDAARSESMRAALLAAANQPKPD